MNERAYFQGRLLMQPFFLMLIKGQAASKMSIVNSIDKIGEVLIPEKQ